MSTVKTNNVQVGQSATAANNFTLYQPAVPDGTVRLGNGNSGAATDVLTVTSGGNLGLGVTPSAWSGVKAFELSPGASIIGQAFNPTLVGNAYYNGANWVYRTSGTATKYEQNVGANGVQSWFIAPYGTAGNPISFTQAMTLDASGNLGVGTSTPSGKLAVSDGTVALEVLPDSANGVVFLQGLNRANTLTNCDMAINVARGAFVIRSGNAGGLSPERARIDSSGNLLVGTTTSSASNTQSAVINIGGAVATLQLNHAGGQSNGFVSFNYAGSSIGSISQTGTTAVAYNTSSDYRLKHDIAPMQNAMQRVAALKPVTYKWNADNSDGEGFIAHELAEVCPQAVTGEKDAVDAEGRPVYQGIDTSFLVATLTAAIQEQQAIITELRSRIEALEAK